MVHCPFYSSGLGLGYQVTICSTQSIQKLGYFQFVINLSQEQNNRTEKGGDSRFCGTVHLLAPVILYIVPIRLHIKVLIDVFYCIYNAKCTN